jgi:hypothetical protein
LPDGSIGKLFLDGGKVDALSEMAREGAIVVSLALADGPSGTFQAFCPPALTRKRVSDSR